MKPPVAVRTFMQSRSLRRGFTLVELLGVIAIIVILVSVMVPTVAAARQAAARARTQVRFSQWVLACTQFRQEYGFYPALGTDNRIATPDDTVAFIRVLAGRNPDGTAVTDLTSLGGNFRRIAFLSLAESDLQDGRLADAFGNTDIGVIWDVDGDGLVRPGVDGVAIAVSGAGGEAMMPSLSVLPASGIRAGVVFYTAGRGESVDDLVVSWR